MARGGRQVAAATVRRSDAGARVRSFDIAKGLGIILVVAGHWLTGRGAFGEPFFVIYSVHMPLFLVVSGVFLKEDRRLWAGLRARFAALLLPWFWVVGLVSLLHLAVGYRGTTTLRLGPQGVHALAPPGMWEPLWFLPYLFAVHVASLLLLRLYPERHRRDLPTALLLLLLLIATAASTSALLPPVVAEVRSVFPVNVNLSAETLFMGVFFMLFGRLQAARLQGATLGVRWFLLPLGLFAGHHLLFNETLNLRNLYVGPPSLTATQALAGVVAILGGSAGLARVPRVASVLASLGRSSLVIFLFHCPVLALAAACVQRLGGDARLEAVVSIAAATVVPWGLNAGRRKLGSWAMRRLPGSRWPRPRGAFM